MQGLVHVCTGNRKGKTQGRYRPGPARSWFGHEGPHRAVRKVGEVWRGFRAGEVSGADHLPVIRRRPPAEWERVGFRQPPRAALDLPPVTALLDLIEIKPAYVELVFTGASRTRS